VTRALLSDVHGVLYVHPDPVPGSVDAVERLERAGIPHLFLTNSTQHEKAWILASLREAGFRIPPERLLTAAEAAGAYFTERGIQRVGWLCPESLHRDLPGLTPIPPRPGAPEHVDAVLVGDLGESFTHEALNRAFRWLLEGAELVALARTRYYRAADGLCLDCGPFVALLEEAAGVRAAVMGKPSPAFFRAGLDRLGVAPGEAAMVGDDLDSDVLPAMDLGMEGILVRTGKFRPDRYRDAPRKADRLVRDLAEAVATFGGGRGG
jgi:HAD superfamily hydrolase (TIGR01458 family)